MNRNFITEFDHPEHNWKWTKMEVHFINNRMQSHIDYTSAVIAERDALRKAAQMALEAMKYIQKDSDYWDLSEEIEALRKELGNDF